MLPRIKKILKNNCLALFLFFISIVIYNSWLSFDVFSSGDYWFNFSETTENFLNYSVWLNNINIGQINLSANMLFWNFFPGIFGYFGFDSNVSDKFLIFWPFIFVTPLASFFLAKKILKNNIASIISALVYCFNTYFLAINTQGHFSLTLAATFAPLALLFFMEALDRENIKYSLLTTIFLFIVGSYDFRIFYIEIFIIVGYFIFHLFNYKQFEKKSTLKKTRIFLIMAISITLLNVYWMLPMAKTGSLTENQVLSRDLIPFSLDIKKTLTLFHPFWTGSIPKWFDDQEIHSYFWLIPIFAFAGLWLNRKNKKILFFGFVALAGVFLAKQESGPFGDLYTWLFKKFPGFNAFREASKFYFAIALSYSILIGAFVKWLWEEGGSYKFRKFSLDPSRSLSAFGGLGMTMKYFFTILIALLFLWNTRSIISGKMDTVHTPKIISKDDMTLRDFMKSQPDFFRTLWIPSEPRWTSYGSLHPKINATEMKRGAWSKFSENYEQGENLGITQGINHILNQPFSQNLLNNSSVRYIITGNANSIFLNTDKIDLKTQNSVVLENKSYKPHIYITKKRETIHQNITFEKLEFESINPSWYKIRLKNLREPVYLNFSDKYHPDWKLRAGDFNWFSAILKNNYFLADKNHFESDARLNSFFLDPEKICQPYACVKNNDGTFDLNLTLYFKPQSYMYLGLILLLITFVVIISYFAKSLINKIKK